MEGWVVLTKTDGLHGRGILGEPIGAGSGLRKAKEMNGHP